MSKIIGLRKAAAGPWRTSLLEKSPSQTVIPDDPALLRKLGIVAGDHVFGYAGYIGDWLGALSARGARVDYTDINLDIVQWVRIHKTGLFDQVRIGDPLIEPARVDEYDWSFSFEPFPLQPNEMPFAMMRSMLNRKGYIWVSAIGVPFNFDWHLKVFGQVYGLSSKRDEIQLRHASILARASRTSSPIAVDCMIAEIRAAPAARDKVMKDLVVINALQQFQGTTLSELRGHLTRRGLYLSDVSLLESLDRIDQLTATMEIQKDITFAAAPGQPLHPEDAGATEGSRDSRGFRADTHPLAMVLAAWFTGAFSLGWAEWRRLGGVQVPLDRHGILAFVYAAAAASLLVYALVQTVNLLQRWRDHRAARRLPAAQEKIGPRAAPAGSPVSADASMQVIEVALKEPRLLGRLAVDYGGRGAPPEVPSGQECIPVKLYHFNELPPDLRRAAFSWRRGQFNNREIMIPAIHPTTRGALFAMNQMTLAGRTLLDATTGEGILAIAAAKLGTQRAIGIDINTQIVKVAKLNAELNRAQDETAFYAQDFAERLPMTEPLPDAVVLNLPPEDYLSIDALLANYPSIHTIILAGGARSAFPRPLDMGQKYIDMFHAHGFYFKTKFTDAIDRYRDGQVWDTYILEKLTQDHPAAAATAAKLSNKAPSVIKTLAVIMGLPVLYGFAPLPNSAAGGPVLWLLGAIGALSAGALGASFIKRPGPPENQPAAAPGQETPDDPAAPALRAPPSGRAKGSLKDAIRKTLEITQGGPPDRPTGRELHALLRKFNNRRSVVTATPKGKMHMHPVPYCELRIEGLRPHQDYSVSLAWALGTGLQLHFTRPEEAHIYDLEAYRPALRKRGPEKSIYFARRVASAPDLGTALLAPKDRFNQLVLDGLNISIQQPDAAALETLQTHLRSFQRQRFTVKATPAGSFMSTPIPFHRLFVLGLTPGETYTYWLNWVWGKGLRLYFSRKGRIRSYNVEKYRAAFTEPLSGRPQIHHYLETLKTALKERLSDLLEAALRLEPRRSNTVLPSAFQTSLQDFKQRPYTIRASPGGRYGLKVGDGPLIIFRGLTGSEPYTVRPEWDRGYGLRIYLVGVSKVAAYDFNTYREGALAGRGSKTHPAHLMLRAASLNEARDEVQSYEYRRRMGWNKLVRPDAWSDPLGENVPAAADSSPDRSMMVTRLRKHLEASLSLNGYAPREIAWLTHILRGLFRGKSLEEALDESRIDRDHHAWIRAQFRGHIAFLLKPATNPAMPAPPGSPISMGSGLGVFIDLLWRKVEALRTREERLLVGLALVINGAAVAYAGGLVSVLQPNTGAPFFTVGALAFLAGAYILMPERWLYFREKADREPPVSSNLVQGYLASELWIGLNRFVGWMKREAHLRQTTPLSRAA